MVKEYQGGLTRISICLEVGKERKNENMPVTLIDVRGVMITMVLRMAVRPIAGWEKVRLVVGG